MKKVALVGGTPRTVIEPLADQMLGATWRYLTTGSSTGSGRRSSRSRPYAGEPEHVTSVTRLDDGVLGYRWPHLMAGTDVNSSTTR